MANYVKFVRGLTSAFEKLTTKNADTLYFIYDDETSTSGRLYLGDREIVCDGGSGGSGVTFLKDLLDVALPVDKSELIDGQVLTYDALTDKWVARDPSTVANVLFDADQFETNDNGEWSLAGFANAPAGSRLTKSSDGKLIWDLPNGDTTEELAELVEQLRTDVDGLTTKFDDYDTSAEVDTKISEAVAAANHLSYKTVNSIEEIDVSATSADQFIYMVKNGEVYDEYMIVNGKLEKVGDWNVNLDDYVTKNELLEINTKVTDLTASVGQINTKVTNLITKVETIETAVNGQEARIAALETAIENKVDQEEYDLDMAELEEFKNAMTWKVLT